jgi:hypothetical protein
MKNDLKRMTGNTLALMEKLQVKVNVVVNNEDSHTVEGTIESHANSFSVKSLAFKEKHIDEIQFIKSDFSEAEVYINI